MSDRKQEPHTADWSGGTFPRYRGEVNTDRKPTLDPACPKPEHQPARPLILAQEQGPRIMVRAIIANATLDNLALAQLTLDLTTVFGGFTCYPMLGGWRDESGAIMQEHGHVFEVSFPVAQREWINTAVDLFAMAGRAIGERWVHIEQHCFNARHVQVNA